MSDVQEYKKRMQLLKALGAKSDTLKQERAEVEAEYLKVENELKDMLTEDGENSFKCEEGTIYLSFIDQVKMPQDQSMKEQFYNYLREEGLYDDMISVNSQKLNGFYRKEKEKAEESAKERGELIQFNMPGIDGVHTVTRIGFRKS